MTSTATYTLHRYFICAQWMLTYLDEVIKKAGPATPRNAVAKRIYIGRTFVHLCSWLGFLYVVVEGWKELGLHDPAIDKLLGSPNVDLLRRFRNGAFHFQRDYFDRRFREFLEGKADPIGWARAVHEELSRFFVEWNQARGADPDIEIKTVNDQGAPATVVLRASQLWKSLREKQPGPQKLGKTVRRPERHKR